MEQQVELSCNQPSLLTVTRTLPSLEQPKYTRPKSYTKRIGKASQIAKRRNGIHQPQHVVTVNANRCITVSSGGILRNCTVRGALQPSFSTDKFEPQFSRLLKKYYHVFHLCRGRHDEAIVIPGGGGSCVGRWLLRVQFNTSDYILHTCTLITNDQRLSRLAS